MKSRLLQKKIFAFCFICLFFIFFNINNLQAQDLINGYTFSQSYTYYFPLHNGTIIGTGGGYHNAGRVNIGFTFRYNGINYTVLGISLQGFVQMGATSIPPVFYSGNIICNNSLPNVICPFQTLLWGLYDTVRYEVIGGAPNRMFIIEWANIGFYSTGYDEICFELRLHETSNIIEFIYHPTNPQTAQPNIQVGLMGNTNADVNTRTSISGWTTTYPGNGCSDMYFIPPGGIPNNNLTYTFTPASACTQNVFPLCYGFGTTGMLDSCWSFVQIIGRYNWYLDSVDTYPQISAFRGPLMAIFPSFGNPGSPLECRLTSPVLNFSSIQNPELSFYMSRDPLYPQNRDSLIVEASTSSGDAWQYITSFQRYSTNATPYWEQKIIDLTSFGGNNHVILGLHGVCDHGADICVDSIVIKQIESVPVVTTTSAAATGSSSAKCGGLVTSNSQLHLHGVCWNTTGNPTLDDPHTNDGANTQWTSYITELNANQLYHVRAYAINAFGTAYGNDLTFTTCSFLSLPYREGFAGISTAGSWPCGWSSQTPNYVTTGLGSGCLTQNSASFLYNRSSKWVFTPGLNLLGGNQYVLNVWYKTDGSPGWLRFQAKYGTRPDSTTMTAITGANISNPMNTNCVLMAGAFTPSTNGVYYIGFNCIDDGVPWYFTFDDILLTGPNGITQKGDDIPKSYCLYQNYPNPFNPATKIKFDIPEIPLTKGARGMFVRLTIYDILGCEVAALINDKFSPGSYELEFDGSSFASGVYFYKLQTQDFTMTRKMLLMK